MPSWLGNGKKRSTRKQNSLSVSRKIRDVWVELPLIHSFNTCSLRLTKTKEEERRIAHNRRIAEIEKKKAEEDALREEEFRLEQQKARIEAEEKRKREAARRKELQAQRWVTHMRCLEDYPYAHISSHCRELQEAQKQEAFEREQEIKRHEEEERRERNRKRISEIQELKEREAQEKEERFRIEQEVPLFFSVLMWTKCMSLCRN